MDPPNACEARTREERREQFLVKTNAVEVVLIHLAAEHHPHHGETIIRA